MRRNDTVMVEIATGKVIKFIKFEMGKLCMITGGANIGRVGVMQRREKLEGAIDIVHVKDAIGERASFLITTNLPRHYFSLFHRPQGQMVM